MKRSFSILARLFLVPPIKKYFIASIEGEENIPEKGNFILISNHQSYFDHFFIVVPFQDRLEKIHFIGKMETIYHPFIFGPLYFFTDTITVNRKAKNKREILKEAIYYLQKGDIIVIYPEGERNRQGQLKRGKTGVAELALATGAPVLPVGISSKKNDFRKIIKIGTPLFFKKNILPQQSSFEEKFILREVTDRIMKALSPLCGKPYPY